MTTFPFAETPVAEELEYPGKTPRSINLPPASAGAKQIPLNRMQTAIHVG
jgi:hypothetical protein